MKKQVATFTGAGVSIALLWQVFAWTNEKVDINAKMSEINNTKISDIKEDIQELKAGQKEIIRILLKDE